MDSPPVSLDQVCSYRVRRDVSKGVEYQINSVLDRECSPTE